MNKVYSYNPLQMMIGVGLGAAVAMGILVSSAVFAQEISESHVKIAKKTVATTRASKKLNDILPAAVARLSSRLISNRPDISTQITDTVNSMAIELAPRRGDLEKEVAKIYARVFSESELDSINEFFKTEVGQKFLAELPIVVREVDKAARIWGTGITRDLSQKVREKLKTDGHL